MSAKNFTLDEALSRIEALENRKLKLNHSSITVFNDGYSPKPIGSRVGNTKSFALPDNVDLRDYDSLLVYMSTDRNIGNVHLNIPTGFLIYPNGSQKFTYCYVDGYTTSNSDGVQIYAPDPKHIAVKLYGNSTPDTVVLYELTLIKTDAEFLYYKNSVVRSTSSMWEVAA